MALAYAFALGVLSVFKGIWLSERSPNWMITGDRFNFQAIGSNDLVDLGFAALTILTFVIYLGMVWNKKKHYPLLLFLGGEIGFVLLLSPQFRLILPALFFPFVYVLSQIKLSPRFLSIGMYVFILVAFVPVFFKLDYGKLNKNASLLNVDTFQAKYIPVPAGITKYSNMKFDKKRCNNFDYFNPIDESTFVFLTGDGALPCVRTSYLRYMYEKTGRLPVLFDENDLGKGFYSK
jgi:hypothetical protein